MRSQLDSARLEVTAGAQPLRQLAWAADGASFEYSVDGQRFRYDIAARSAEHVQAVQPPSQDPPPAAGPARGRQYESALSPDGQTRAFYRDRNVWVSDAEGANERQIAPRRPADADRNCGPAARSCTAGLSVPRTVTIHAAAGTFRNAMEPPAPR